MIVSHPSICSMESAEFNKSWEAIRQCCVDLGGDKYKEKVDMLLTSSLDCDRAQKVAESLINEKENDYKNERYARKFEENGTLIGIKIEGDQLPSTTDIKNHIEHYNTGDVCVKSVEDGCLMITLEMFSSAFENFGYFLAVIDKLLQHIFPAKAVSVDKNFKAINISVKSYQLVEESKWHRPDLEGKTTKRNTDDNTREIAKSNQDALKFRAEKFSSGKEYYDRLLSVFHIGTEVKRCLLETYLHEKKRRSSTIRLSDLALSTIDILLRFNCFDMFWDCCLLNTCLEDVLNSHKKVLYRIYQNSIRQKRLPYISTANYIPSLTKTQWEILFKSGESSGIKGDGNIADISATKDIALSSLDETLHTLLLYTVCPLFQSVNSVSECQIQILEIAVMNSECERFTFENIWNRIESHIISITDHCKEISLSLLDGKYTTSAYSLRKIENKDLQNSINRHSHLKVVQLITNIAKDALVDVLKGRLLGANFRYAFNEIKVRMLPQLNNYERQSLYLDGSVYKGNLSDFDINLI
ncbi:unnamed protein product [Mytilus edulis]|uniref:Uncharacterized protein n=1 Tax=Mytilus edulis TaxID=6550 RepID=A0A8S3VKW0_MYTED|nr:unnamed protein product [Mytilus edulis]